jgi:pimeloyl-ACP methyl ester carboxylesterase
VDEDAIDAGLSEKDGRWRLAMDPAAFAVGRPDMAGLVARSTAPVVFARGEHDPMNTDEQLAALAVEAVTLPGLGHSAHVEDPAACFALLPVT